ncbi:GNAT family N-acetyltransferase [Actinoplanes sp. NPDC049802]|uniref:GNAT family N-acetyltransferase n=1 Tax=Actinoplanes sp. NPDC049802 TaxID=3154742 RepID=UPI00340D3B5A
MIETRALDEGDWKIWRELRLAALTEAPQAFCARLADWQGDGDREERWRSRLAVPGSYNVVATLDGQPVGMASGMPTDQDGVVELISMYVAPAGRGRGVGDHILDAVERWARQTGAETVRLAVKAGNEHAWALYRRNGFHDTGDFLHGENLLAKRLDRAD